MVSFALVVLAANPVQWLGPPPPSPATRIITLAPSLTQTVLALGAKESLVGVSRFCEFSEVAELPRAGGFNDLAMETIIALKPQVLIVQKSPGNRQAVEKLARLGVSVLALPLTTIEDVSTAMTQLGRVLGRETEAKTLVDELAQARAKERSQRAKAPKRVLFVVGYSPLVVAGPGSFADELLQDCGAINACDKAPTPYPTYSLEKALAMVPDVIIDAANAHEGRAALERLGLLKTASWVRLPTKDLLQPGPALAKALPSLCALVR